MAIILLLHLVLAITVTCQPNVNFMLDCGLYPQVCNNKCFAVYKGGAPQTTTYSAVRGPQRKQIMEQRRRTAGTIPNPCCNGRMTAPPTCSDTDGTETTCNSPDEYPYASTDEYGNGPTGQPAFIRCTGIEENTYEGTQSYNNGVIGKSVANGGCGRQAGCRITIGFGNIDIRSDACINKQGQSNDGHYYKYDGTTYATYKRDVPNSTIIEGEGVYTRFEPGPELFIPLILRRELLLDDGTRVMVAPEAPGEPYRHWVGEFWSTGWNTSAQVVRELKGRQRSSYLR